MLAAMAKRVAPKSSSILCRVGVCLERTPGGWLAIATNGHITAIGRLQAPDVDAIPPGFEIIIPRDAARKLAKLKSADLDFDDNQGPRTLRFTGGALTLDPAFTGHKFHAWRQIVPQRISGETAQFSAHCLAAIQSCADDAAGVKPGNYVVSRLQHNGGGCAQVTFSNLDLIGLIMPIREDKCANGARPFWVLNDASTAASAAATAFVGAVNDAITETQTRAA